MHRGRREITRFEHKGLDRVNVFKKLCMSNIYCGIHKRYERFEDEIATGHN